MRHRGFILQPTYRLEAGRPVVHLYGVLEDGRSFVVRDRRLVPRFYVRAQDAVRAREMRAPVPSPTGLVSLEGEPVLRIEVTAPSDTPPLRDRLTRGGVPTYEADVRFAMRYLIDRRIKGALEILATPQKAGAGVVFEDPELAPGDWTPRLRVLSFDIETDPRARQLLSIALFG